MRPTFLIWFAAAVWILLPFLPAQAQEPTPQLTLSEYVQKLDSSLAQLKRLKDQPQQASDLLNATPSAWHVQVNGKEFEVSAESIRRDLAAWQAKPTSEALDRIRQHLETLRYQASGYDAAPPDISSRRLVLSNILARGEFQNVRGQSWIDRMKQRFRDWLIRLLGKAVNSSAIPMISDILVYGLMIVAVLAVAYWLYRSLREGARLETIMPVNLPVSAKEWPLWLAEARAAGEKNEWRDAIHFAYWAGISFLEAQGAWRPDSARTPREYLRLLPMASAQQPALRALTVRLEGVWYGMQTAGAEGFEQTLAELERLGCPCN